MQETSHTPSLKIRLRPYISFGLILSSLMLIITGIVLYIKPVGRVALWIGWSFFGWDKTQWEYEHHIFAFFSLILFPIHVYLNWAAIVRYFKQKWVPFMIILFLCTITILGTALYWPPFYWINQGTELIKEYWARGNNPPLPHAEDKPLAYFIEKENLNAAQVLSQLQDLGLSWADDQTTLMEIYNKTGISPAEIYSILKKINDKEIND